MKLFFIAGERSGDLHASNLIKEILKLDAGTEIVGFGGSLMENVGMRLLSHYREISFMGFYEVVKNLMTIRRKIKECEKLIKKERPDVLVLVDFPGFNLRMAKYAKTLGIKTAYYISPKIWAWKKNRIKKIRKVIDKMYVIFPFEVDFYESLNYKVEYVGNPLVEHVKNYDFNDFRDQTDKNKYIAFLPGSRSQEIQKSIPIIQSLANRNPALIFMVGGVDNVDREEYSEIESIKNVKVLFDRTYDILKYCDASITTSGTATLETALIGTPQVVCYKTSNISYQIAKRVVKLNYISLVNLIVDQPIVKELIQDDFTVEKLEEELQLLLNSASYLTKMKNGYAKVKETLTSKDASVTTAQLLLA
jgi:lipid-A-disaccharide synthase